MLRISRFLVPALAAAFIGASTLVVTAADDKSADGAKPAAAVDKPAKGRQARLTKPWREITSLTEEQKMQLAEIRGKANDEVKQIRDRERAACMAILNESQKTELTALEEKMAAEKKIKKNDGTAKQTDLEKKTP
jgi:Spy/CpxP family protein refolding chaperone